MGVPAVVDDFDDFENVPTEAIGEQAQLYPTKTQALEAKLTGLLSNSKLKPTTTSKAGDILKALGKGKTIDIVAESMDVEPADVKSLANISKDLTPAEVKDLTRVTANKASVFDIDARLQEAFDWVLKSKKMCDPDSEAGLGYTTAEIQMLKLVINYMEKALSLIHI